MRKGILKKFSIIVLAAFVFTIARPVFADSPQQLWDQKSAEFQPNLQAGSADFAVPITIPPGRNGLQPQLSLQYSSLAQNDQNIVGYGWMLPSNRIVRKNETGIPNLYTDGKFTLELNGGYYDLEDISLSAGQYGEYGVDIEGDFSKIYFNSSDDSWTIESKTGVEMTFGSSAASRIDNPSDSSQIYAWYLEDVRDLNDNYVSYTYYKDGAAIYPETINYTGNNATAGPFDVRFEPFATGTPSARQDISSNYAPGFELEYQYLVNSIQIDVDTETVLAYDLNYATGDNGYRSLLSEVTKYGLDSNSSTISLEPWQFTYTQPTDSWTNETNNFSYAEENYGIAGTALADYSGDGIVDVFKSVNSGSLVQDMHEGHPDGFTDDNSSWTLPPEVMNERDTVVMDVNGDQLTDVMRSFGSGTYTQWIYLNDGDGSFTDASSSWTLPQVDFGASGILIGDINGDGLPDMTRNVGCSPCSNQVWINDGETGWTDASSEYTLPTQTFNDSVVFADVNHDGLDDYWRSSDSGTGSWTNWLYLNEGDGTFVNVSSSWDLPNAHHPAARVGDFNGDGYLDVVKYDDVWLGRPGGWDLDTAFGTVPGSSASPNWQYMDFNGDGLTDAVYEACSFGCTGQAYIHDGEHPDVLESVIVPEGAEIAYTYTGSAQLEDGSGNPVNPSLPFVFPVVTEMTTDDGLGNMETTTFNYEGGVFSYTNQYDGRFGGFNKVTKTYDDGSYDITYFHQGGGVDATSSGEYEDSFEKIGRVYRVENYDADDDLLREVITGWDLEDLGDDRAFVFPFREGTRIYDDVASHKDTAQRFEFDAYGNITKQEQLGTATVSSNGGIVDTGTDKRTTYSTYVTTTSPYLVGLKALEAVKDNAETVVAGRAWFYDGEAYQDATIGNMTRFGELISTAPDYAQTDYDYNAYGNQISVIDPNGNETTYDYDSWNLYPEIITQPLIGDTLQTTDLTTGKLLSTEDPNGSIKEWDYDSFGRPEEERISDVGTASTLRTVRTYAYANSSAPNSVATTSYSDATTSTTSYQYIDGFGRSVQTREPMETGGYSVIESAYDARGRQDLVSLPYADTGSSYTSPNASASLIETAYDAIGRVTNVVDDVGNVTTEYADRSKKVTDEEGKIKIYTYDAFGNLTKVEEKKNTTFYATNYEFNAINKLKKITDSSGNIREFTYDLLGRQLTKTGLHATSSSTYGTWTYTYDDGGNVIEMTDPNGVTVTYTYDDLNRLLTEDADDAAGVEVDYDYDTGTNGLGKLAYVTKGDVETEFDYNARGDLDSKILTIDAASFGATSYDYDYLGRILTTTYPNGEVSTTTYNSQGLPETLEFDSIDVVTDVDYNENDQPTAITYGNGVTTTNTYDVAQRYWLTDRETTNGTDALQDLTYTFDNVGNITQVVDASDLKTALTATYGYNDFHQLTSASTTGSVSPYSDYSNTYVYNALGNMTSQTGIGTMTYGDVDHPHALTGYGSVTLAYDDNGNLVSNGTKALTWNYRNEMTSFYSGSVTTDYLYDQDGDRVRKSVGGAETTTYIGDFVYEEDADREEINLSLLGQPVFEWREVADTTVTKNWIHSDHLGSVAVMTDDSGDWTTARDYYPYGADRVFQTQGTPVDNRFDYTNKEQDDESGLSYFEARYMSTDLGRFISEDPWEGDYSDPQSLNKYAYARNNPIKFVDPDGQKFSLTSLNKVLGATVSVQKFIGDSLTFGQYSRAVNQASNAGAQLAVDGVSVGSVASAAGQVATATARTAIPAAANGALSAIGSGAGVGATATSQVTRTTATTGVTVYQSVSEAGVVQYVGITNNIARRAAEHAAQRGIQISPIQGLSGLTRYEARAVEQALIEKHGLQRFGGTLLNKINSISIKNPSYGAAIRRGSEILNSLE